MTEVIGVIGASSFVGLGLLPKLASEGIHTIAFSRRARPESTSGIEWRVLEATGNFADTVPTWITLLPIWALPPYFPMLEAAGAEHVVVLSSTSRYTKGDSIEPLERELAARLVASEEAVLDWADGNGVSAVILRPTMIYGFGADSNVSFIARFIRRFRFFPLASPGNGLRQPVHAIDVAEACLAAIRSRKLGAAAYDISGSEIFTYRELVGRVFAELGIRPRILLMPAALLGLLLTMMSLLPRYRFLTAAMAHRMNSDLSFEHGDAARDLGYAPKPFTLMGRDLPGH